MEDISVLTNDEEIQTMLNSVLTTEQKEDFEDEDQRLTRECHAMKLNLGQWLNTCKDNSVFAVEVVRCNTTPHFLFNTIEIVLQSSMRSEDDGPIKRSMSDFKSWNHALKIRFPGAFVPPLPTNLKHDSEYCKHLLQAHLDSVLSHSYLAADDLTLEFLTSKKKFDHTGCSTLRPKLISQGTLSLSSKRWSENLCTLADIPQADHEIAIAKRKLKSTKAHMLSLLNCFKQLHKRQNQLALVMLKTQESVERMQLEGLAKTSAAFGKEAIASNAQATRVQCLIEYEIQLMDALLNQLKPTKTVIRKVQHEAQRFQTIQLNATLDALSRQVKLGKQSVELIKANMVKRRSVCVVLDLKQFFREHPVRLESMFSLFRDVKLEHSRQSVAAWQPEYSAAATPVCIATTTTPTVLTAMYSFKSRQEDELNVKRGEELSCTFIEEEPDWYRAKCLTTGKEGLVPVAYMCSEELMLNDENKKEMQM